MKTKPRMLTSMEIANGELPAWCERYATWLSEQPSFQNQTNRAAFGRVKAIRALTRNSRFMLPVAGWSNEQQLTLVDDIVQTAKLKAIATLSLPVT